MDDHKPRKPSRAGSAWRFRQKPVDVAHFAAGPGDLLAIVMHWAPPVPEYANREKAPHYIDWLTRIYARPATLKLFRTSRSLGQRALEIAADLGVAT